MSAFRRLLLAALCAVMALGTPLAYATAAQSDPAAQAVHGADAGVAPCDCCENEGGGTCAQHCAAAFGSALLEIPAPGGFAPAADLPAAVHSAGFTSRSGSPGLHPPR
jgi:hypothetical protein